MNSLSPRLRDAVAALPLAAGMRVLEIGCGPGAAARAVARSIAPGKVVAMDRSASAVDAARRAGAEEIRAGILEVRLGAVEDLLPVPGEPPFDLAFAFRVGALDGRHPELFDRALQRLAAVLSPTGRLFIDGGAPLRELPIRR